MAFFEGWRITTKLNYSNPGPERSGKTRTYGKFGTTFALFLVFAAGTWWLVVKRELDHAGGDWARAAAPILWVIVPTLVLTVRSTRSPRCGLRDQPLEGERFRNSNLERSSL